jgi:hypothetical protein
MTKAMEVIMCVFQFWPVEVRCSSLNGSVLDKHTVIVRSSSTPNICSAWLNITPTYPVAMDDYVS